MAKGRISDDEEEEEEEFEEGEDLQEAEGGEGGSDEEEEEDEEEGQDEYEKDGFIVDEDEDEEPEEEEEERSSDEEAKARKKKRKKRNEEEDELDEDDYELLREHNVFHRPKSGNKTKFKRLKKAGKQGVVDDRRPRGGLSDDEEEEEEGGRRGRTAEEELKRTLFGDDEGVPPDDVGEEEEEPEEEEEIGEEDDEMADFIVDEEEGDDEGQPFRRKKAKKKKAPRQAPGISSFALQEAQDIFGDVSALLDARRQQELENQKAEMDLEGEEDEFGRKKSNKLLEKQFEPSLLEEKFMTEKDDRIRDIDVAERLQILEETVGSFPPADTASKEASWIYERAFGKDAFWKVPGFENIVRVDKEDIVKQIASVVQLMHEEKLELPFIAMYRKERCLDLLQVPEDHNRESNGDGRPKLIRYEALWAVQQWDKKWLLLRRRKLGLEGAYEKRKLYESRRGNSKEELFQSLLEALREAESEQAVDDVDAKFNLHCPPDEIDVEPGQFKRPKRRSFYSICRKGGLGIVASRFGLTPEKLGENISAMYKRHEVEDDALAPLEVASSHLGSEFRDGLSVLKGARHMVAVEISTEPAVREYVRHVYIEKAVISTKPTLEGNTVIDAFHQYAVVKWLQSKPVDKFDDAQWLLLQKAEEEKLLEVTIGLPSTVVTDNLMPEFETLYLSDGVSAGAQLWNEQRKQVIKDSILQMLLPAMEKEVRMLLSLRSKQWVAAQCATELWNKVSVGPYVDQDPEKRDESFDYEGLAPRVMACCWGAGKPATTFVMLDSAGEIVNILYTGYLTIRDDERKKQDQEKLLDFVMENQPHVVVLGTANLQCRRIRDQIFEVIFKIVEEHPRDLAEGLNTIGVVFGDETIPRLYENSRISEEQLVGHPGIVRRAVGLGRYLQNPLAMVATLCGPSKEVLSLGLHSLQNFLAPDEVYETVEKIMITVTNQVGVDVNMAASHDWLFAPLQFVSGLGPRKASYVQRSIQGAGRISTRRELLATLRLMGRKVFINAAGFIRVRGTGQASTGNHIMDPLDDTRIHPESYELAKRMAEDIFCEAEGTKAEDMDEDALELAIEHVKRHPLHLAHLDLEVYGSHLAQNGPVANMQTLQMIRSELLHGYQELRNPSNPLSQDEEFHLLSGESEDTLAEGSIVHVTVRKIQQSRVMCVLESGLIGFINKEELSDDANVDPADNVAEGSIVTCRVKSVNKASYSVDLTCKGSALRSENWPTRRPKDPYFVPDLSVLRIEEEKAKKKSEEEKRNAFKPRMIVHPQFQNVSLADAVQGLSEKDVGEVIIRPSSKGPSHLSMTLKFFDGLYVHIDIVEGGKDSRDLTSFLRLGKTLTIGDETFEDLDEVIARYIDPLVGYLKEMLRYRKFKRGNKAEVDEALREEKAKNPMRIPYFFSVCHEHPGAFRLSYIKNMHTVSHEYISVSPKGLKFRKRIFDSTDKLVSYFQKHFKEPIPDVAPRRAMAAMVPPRSPAPSGSGGYKSGQWAPSRSGDGPSSSAWDSSNSWDRSGGGGRSSGSWGRGAGSAGTNSSWDQQGRGGTSSSGAWAPPGPPQAAGGWNGWAGPGTAAYGGGRGPPGPGDGGRSTWDRQQQAQRGGFKSGTNGWGQDGFSDGPSLTPLTESSWGSRKPNSGASTWDQPTSTQSGWESEQESHGRGRSNWEQSRGDPRRGGVDRDTSKSLGSSWDQPATKEASSARETSEPPSQSGGSSALWDGSAAAKEPTSSDVPSQSGGNSAWEAQRPTQRRAGGRWDKPAEEPTQSDSGWTSKEPEPQSSGFGTGSSDRGDSSWDPSSTEPAASGSAVSQSDNWISSDGAKEKPLGGEPQEKAPPQRGWDAGSVRRNGWDSQPGTKPFQPSGGDRLPGDPRRAGSGWDQQVRGGPRQGVRTSNWDQPAPPAPAAYSPATQSGASYSPTQSGWSTDWDKTPVKGGPENTRPPPSKTSPENRNVDSWNVESESLAGRSSSWDGKEPGVPGVSDSGNEPAAPGTADVAGGGPGNRAGYNPASGPPKDQSLPWVWSGAT
ncbi:unnamed protein product [Calypogeia fissa]